MALEVIGAGPGRTATLSLKFALEHIGFGPCYHMAEVMKGARRNVPLWLDVADGKPDWDAVFEGYRSTTDYPASVYWRELAEYYPQAKVVLTVRDAESWWDSVSQTIHSPHVLQSVEGTPIKQIFEGTYMKQYQGRIDDREFMIDWYERHNQEVIDTIDADRLLVFHPREGWEPLCEFLGVPVPEEAFPKVNSRDEITQISEERSSMPTDLAEQERSAEAYIEQMRAAAFS